MFNKEANETLSNFFLDGAKLIFGSLVVGVFVPGAAGSSQALTSFAGIVITALFLFLASLLASMARRTL